MFCFSSPLAVQLLLLFAVVVLLLFAAMDRDAASSIDCDAVSWVSPSSSSSVESTLSPGSRSSMLVRFLLLRRGDLCSLSNCAASDCCHDGGRGRDGFSGEGDGGMVDVFAACFPAALLRASAARLFCLPAPFLVGVESADSTVPAFLTALLDALAVLILLPLPLLEAAILVLSPSSCLESSRVSSLLVVVLMKEGSSSMSRDFIGRCFWAGGEVSRHLFWMKETAVQACRNCFRIGADTQSILPVQYPLRHPRASIYHGASS